MKREVDGRLVVLLQFGILAVLFIAWEFGARANTQVAFFFSRPSSIVERLVLWMSTQALWTDVGITLLETILGFVGGVSLGLALAFLCYRSRLAERVLMPFLDVANAMPRLIFGPIFVLWFGLGLGSKAFLGMSIVVFIVFFATFQGLKEVDENLILKVRLLGGSERDVTRHVLLPSALSWVFTSLRTSMGFALVGAVVGEYMGSSAGIGHRIEFAENMFDSTGVFAGLALLSLLVVVLNRGLRQVERVLGSPSASVSERRAPRGRWALVAIGLAAIGLGVVLLRPGTVAPARGTNVMKTSMATGGKSSIVYLPAAIAEFNGDFARASLQVDVQDVKGGAAAAKALIGGSVQFASMALDHAIKAKAQRQDLVLLALYTRYPGLTLVVDERLRDRVEHVRDLRGLKIGVTSLGSGSHLALNALLVKNGLSPSDVEAVTAGTSTMVAALAQGAIQAGMMADPFATQAIEQGKAFALYDLTTERDTEALYGSDYPFTGLVTRRDVMRSEPQLVERMVTAIAAALHFIHTQDAAVVARVLPQDYRADLDLYVMGLAHSMPALSPDGMITRRASETVIRSLKETGSIPDDVRVDAESVYDMSVLRKVLGK